MDGNKKTILQLFRNQSINQSINYYKSLTEKSKQITNNNKQKQKQQTNKQANNNPE
jgi:protein required for attachment to host cells